MKKNNTYSDNNETDLADIIKSLWGEKILILSISIICGLIGYFYALLKPQEFKTEIILKNPPTQIFEAYNLFHFNNNNISNSINNNSNNNIAETFVSDFKLNLLSLDNLQIFLEESKEFDNFKEYLKSRNISASEYFANKISEAKEKNIIIRNKYFLNHTKELDGAIFLNKYVEFIKKKTIVELKNNLKLTMLNVINLHQEALESAKKIQLENPILKTLSQQQVVNEPNALFYVGTKVLTEHLNSFDRRMIKLENDQFNYNVISQNALTLQNPINLLSNFVLGLILGSFLSLVIIYLKNILK